MTLERRDGDDGEVERLGADGERAAAQPGEVEQVADEALEPARLAVDHRPRSGGLEHPVLERLRVAADRGERCLQLVAHGEEERPLGLLGAAELPGEVVERRRERRGLARARDRERLGRRTCCERPARVGDACDGPRDRPREEQRDDGGEPGADEPGDAEPEGERRPVGGQLRRGPQEDDRLVAVPAGRVEEARATHLDAAARDAPGAQSLGARRRVGGAPLGPGSGSRAAARRSRGTHRAPAACSSMDPRFAAPRSGRPAARGRSPPCARATAASGARPRAP